jgi:hypothetical protein
MWQRHARVAWVLVRSAPQGGFYAYNERTGDQVYAPTEMGVHEFAADSARAPGHLGAGDLVARAAGALGLQKCSPCAERQAALNRMMPAVFRRR